MQSLVILIGAKAVMSYFALGAFLCIVLAAELAFPRGRLIGREERLRAILFVVTFIPISAIFTSLARVAVTEWLAVDRLLPLTFGALTGGILADFFYYWYHRAQHSVPWLWRFHSVHHSVEELGAGTGYHHWLEAPLKTLLVGLPVLLFIPSDTSVAMLFFLTVQGYYIHSTTRLNLGPLAFLVADNRVHRIHHSLEARHFDRNFGSFTMLWDWLFGTAYFPDKDEWPAVGLEGQASPRTLREYLRLPPNATPLGIGERAASPIS